MSSKKNRNKKNEEKIRKSKILFGAWLLCTALFFVLLIINPSTANIIGLCVCLVCAMRMYLEIR